MKFERLSVPHLPLPDLVAFNARVHERVDPWWRRWWVRWSTWAALTMFALVAAMWVYFASGLPSSQTLLAYQPPLPTNIRGYDGTPVQTFARERRVELSYDEFPPLVVHAFLSAEDKNFFEHSGIDVPGLIGAVADFTAKSVTGGGRAKGGSTITQQVAKYLLQDRATTSDARLARQSSPSVSNHPNQTADPRDLSQLDLPRPQRLRNPGGGARLFRQGYQRAYAVGGGLSCRPSQGAVELRPRPGHAEGPRPSQLRAARDVAKWLHH